jgi:23S rRNA (adenine2503-C2)-methyltransferase
MKPSMIRPPVISEKRNIKAMTLREIERFISSKGEKRFRASQFFKWLHFKGALSFDEMTDIPRTLRNTIAELGPITKLEIDKKLVSKDGSIKYRFKTPSGHFIESVYIPDKERRTICVSTQVGCKMGCDFCLTGKMGFVRNLGADEIVDQVRAIAVDLRASGVGKEELQKKVRSPHRGLITNVVFMGMGEPLDNFGEVVRAVEILTHPEGYGFSHRHVTVSTVGLVPEMIKFIHEVNAKLAISLNATTDEVRSKIMPINQKYPIQVLMDTVQQLPVKKGDRITIEYVVIRDVNDSVMDMKRLVRLVSNFPAKINLIPYNPNPVSPYQPPSKELMMKLLRILIDNNITAIIRASKGQDVMGACGQLATMEEGENG